MNISVSSDKGGGATVIEEGFKIIEAFEKSEDSFAVFVKSQSDNLSV